MKLARPIVLLAVLAALTGCGSIGEGSTVVSIEVRDPNYRAITGPFPVGACLRDQMLAVATFTDGTQADFSYRVTWVSSDPSVVEVSNGEIPAAFVSGGEFTTFPGSTYRPGTLVPRAGAGGTATITAHFLGMTSSKEVQITQPTFRIAPLVPGIDPNQAPPTMYMGPSTLQRFGFYVEESDGHFLLPTSQNLIGSLNPVLWRFQGTGNTYVPGDPADATDFDTFVVPDATSPHASITPASGVVRAIAPAGTVYTVQATTSLCEDVAEFTPTATVRVAPFTTTNPLTLVHEADINGPNVAPTGDLIAGTGEVLTVLANLDTDGNLATAEQTQDLSGQSDVNIVHTLVCDPATDTNCTCDTGGGNCTKRLLGNSSSFIFSLVSDDRAEATVSACYTNVDTTHADDCEEDPADSSQFELASDPLSIHVIPVDLTGTGASLQVLPSTAAELAFAYPGQRFEAYGNFTALGGTTPFAGGTSATATQKISRYVTWLTRAQGSTESATNGFVRNASDGYFGDQGTFNHFEDVATNTVLDINITPAAPFAAIAAPANPVPFTICPSTAGSCP